MKKYSLLIAGTMILLFTFYFTGFGSAHKEGETLNSTFIQVEKGDLYARQSPLLEEVTLDKRIEQSEVIVSGTVAEILPATETMDLVIPLMEDFRKKSYNFLHTDIIIKVDEFIGNSSYEYDEIVVRRNGGRLDNFVHIYDMENYEVGEKVLIFGLEQPDGMTQVPNGYSKQQYYILQPDSKYISDSSGSFSLESNPEEKVTVDKVKSIKEAKN